MSGSNNDQFGPSATTEGQRSTDWVTWYLETLDALSATIQAANIDWATDAHGEPWIVEGDRAGSIPATPCAFILEFTKRRDEAESSPHAEFHRIESRIAVLMKGDPKDQEYNLRQAIKMMGKIETALYADRSLGGTCRRTQVAEAVPFDSPTGDAGSLAGAGITLEIDKTAPDSP